MERISEIAAIALVTAMLLAGLSLILAAEEAITRVSIDGDAADWVNYEVSVTDPSGDHQGGGFDIAAVSVFANDEFLYVLVETHGPREDYEQIDLDIRAAGRQFVVSFSPEESGPGFMGDVTGGAYEFVGQVAGSSSAAAAAVEFRMPLSAFGDITKVRENNLVLLNVRPMGGKCCNPPGWYSIDQANYTRVSVLAEREATRSERLAEWLATPFTGPASAPFLINDLSPALDGARGLSINKDETRAYVVSEFSGALAWVDIDPASPTFGAVTTIAKDLFILNDVAVTRGEMLAYVSREAGREPGQGQNVITRVDLRTRQTATATDRIGQPTNIVLSQDEAEGYVVDLAGGQPRRGGLYRVNLRTGSTKPIATGLDEPFAVAVNHEETVAYVACECAKAGDYPKGDLLRIDLRTGRVSTVAEEAIFGASGVTLSADEKIAFVTEFGPEPYPGGSLSVINIDPSSADYGKKTVLVTGLYGAHDVKLNKAQDLAYFVEVGNSTLKMIRIDLSLLR